MNAVGNIARQFVTIAGIIIYIFGLIGNALNICVFATWCRPQRRMNQMNNNGQRSNSSLYLLASSCANFITIIYPLLTRIIFDGFGRPKREENELVTCKLRYYVLHSSDLISLICVCMATLDRYLISSREVRLRRLSLSRRRTKLVLLLIICSSGLHNIPIAFYYEASENGECMISSRIYLYYYLCVIQIFLHGIFPMCFLSIFGGLTYKQLKTVQQINNHGNIHSDRQLSRMLLLLCIAILISSVPYCMQNIYMAISQDFTQQLVSYDLLFYYISAILFFTNATLSFYVFFISTPNFRKELKKILQRGLCRRHLADNQVHTVTTVHNTQ